MSGQAATAAAFEEVAEELASARAEGRMVLRIPLGEIHVNHLIRDRVGLEPEALEELKASISARGQQTPVEVMALEDGAYALISGWRRLLALQALEAENPEGEFGTVQALLRRPADQGAAYVAMVEENEIRAGLSFYERARVVVMALRAGIFDSEKTALQTLFANVSYSKRSKIKSFVPLVEALDGALNYPARLPEHTGLALARRLKEAPELAEGLIADLAAINPEDAEAEPGVDSPADGPEDRIMEA